MRTQNKKINPLSLEEQLDVVNKAISWMEENREIEVGLCLILTKQLPTGKSFGSNVSDGIPLFTHFNATLHAHAPLFRDDTYWWNYWVGEGYDYKNRMIFLKWMRKKLNRQLIIKNLFSRLK